MSTAACTAHQASLHTLAEKLVLGASENLALVVGNDSLRLHDPQVSTCDRPTVHESIGGACVIRPAVTEVGDMLLVFTPEAARVIAGVGAADALDGAVEPVGEIADMFYESVAGIFHGDFDAHWAVDPGPASLAEAGPLAETDDRVWAAIRIAMAVDGADVGEIWLLVDLAICDAVWGAQPDEPAALDEPVEQPAPVRRPSGPLPESVRRVMKIRVPLIVCLAEKKVLLSEIMKLGVGSIMEFDRAYSEHLELRVNNQTIGEGEAVKISEKFGLKVSRVIDPASIFRGADGRDS